MAYEYVTETEVKRYKKICTRIMEQTCALLKEEGIHAQYNLIGSGAKGLVTRNGNGPFDLDYNLIIQSAPDMYSNNLNRLKDIIRITLDKASGANNRNVFPFCKTLSYAQNSTSAHTVIVRNSYSVEEFRFDVGVLSYNIDGMMQRLVRNTRLTYNGEYQPYIWNQVPYSDGIRAKADYIRKCHEWSEVKKRYLDKKNMYLRLGDRNHPSYVVYIETINEVYDLL